MDSFSHKDYFYRLILCAKKLSASSQPAIRGYWDFKRINSTGDDDVSIYSGTVKQHVSRKTKDFNTKARPSSASPLPISCYRQNPPPPPHRPLSMGKSGSAVSVIGLSISTSFSVSVLANISIINIRFYVFSGGPFSPIGETFYL